MRVVVFALFLAAHSVQSIAPAPSHADSMKLAVGACPCEHHSLCEPVKVFKGREVFGVSNDVTSWQSFDLKSLTTVSMGQPDGALLCEAHSKNVRVLMRVQLPVSAVDETSAVWSEQLVAVVAHSFADGVVVDLDATCLVDAACVQSAAKILLSAKTQLSENRRGWLVVVLPWSPLALDGRFHNFAPLAVVADMVLVVSADTRSNLMDRCIGGPNAHPVAVTNGLQHYIDMGIPKNKLIMALSWFAYDYMCMNGSLPQVCLLNTTDSSCGDWLASKVIFDPKEHNSTILFDRSSSTWVTSYVHPNTEQLHQVWFEDGVSLSAKYLISRTLSLGGVGILDLSFHDAALMTVLRNVWTK